MLKQLLSCSIQWLLLLFMSWLIQDMDSHCFWAAVGKHIHVHQHSLVVQHLTFFDASTFDIKL